MKTLEITPVDRPESFLDVKFTEDDYRAAVKRGPIKAYALTAVEAVRNSKGLYKILEDKPKMEIELVGLKPPSEMTKTEIAVEMASYGKPPRKGMTLSKCVAFLEAEREKLVENIVDD